jgi:peptidoglycan/LPS O-acetylase OafA/YrhL
VAARSSALDGLRGSAALAVLAFHVWLYSPDGLPGPRHALGDKVLFELNLGLICFFVLSGFLLFRPFARTALTGAPALDLRGYALRRAARILPAYYACLAGALLLYEIVGAGRLVPPPGQLATFFFFGQSYSASTLTAVNAVTWTLCVEVVFYLLLPLLGWAVIRLGPTRVRAQVALLVGLIGVSVGWNAITHFSGWGPVASKSLPAYIGDFSFGMLAALWIERLRVRRRAWAAAGPARPAGVLLALSGAAAVAATGYWHERWGSHTLVHQILMDMPAAAGFALLVAALASARGRAPSLLFRARPLVGAGVISYGLYLWHIPLILVLIELGLLPGSLAPRLAVVLGLTVGVAWLSWRVVERPVLRRVARRSIRPATT